jgi:hypothetical protein
MTSIDETALALVNAVVDNARLSPEAVMPYATCPILWEQESLKKLFRFANTSLNRLNAADAACDRAFKHHLCDRGDVAIDERVRQILSAWWLRERLAPSGPRGWTATSDGFAPM